MTDDELRAKAARERRYDLRTPIIRAIYDVMQAIEACGASVELTRAVTLAGELMEPTRLLLEERDALLDRLQAAERIPREPTPAMFIAGTKALAEVEGSFARHVWQAMYDAAQGAQDTDRAGSR